MCLHVQSRTLKRDFAELQYLFVEDLQDMGLRVLEKGIPITFQKVWQVVITFTLSDVKILTRRLGRTTVFSWVTNSSPGMFEEVISSRPCWLVILVGLFAREQGGSVE